MKPARTHPIVARLPVWIFGAAISAPFVAQAHTLQGEKIGFLSGVKHPVSGLDHVVAMVAVGLWGAQLGAPAVWLLPVTFPLVMAFGGFLGLIGIPLPADELGIALSGVLLGAVVLRQWRPRLPIAAVIVGAFGLFHGYAHGHELPPGQDSVLYSLGFVIATGCLHAVGIGIGTIHRWGWGRTVIRILGGGVLLAGLMFVWKAVG